MEIFDITNISVIIILIIGAFLFLVSLLYFFIPFWIYSIKRHIKEQTLYISQIQSLNLELLKTLKNIEESLINIENNKN